MGSEKEKIGKTAKAKMSTNLTAMGLLGNVHDMIGEALLTRTEKPDIASLLSIPAVAPIEEGEEAEAPVVVLEKKEKAPSIKEEIKKTKNAGKGDYARFLIPPPRALRKNSVYVSLQNHERLMLVMRKLENKISMAEYLENIIEDHFEKYGSELRKLIENVQEGEKDQLNF